MWAVNKLRIMQLFRNTRVIFTNQLRDNGKIVFSDYKASKKQKIRLVINEDCIARWV